MEEKIKKFILLLIVIIASDIFGMDTQENTHMLVRKNFSAIEANNVASAEGKLNQKEDPEIYRDIVSVLTYLLSHNWEDSEIGRHFDSTSDQVPLLLRSNVYCDLMRDIHYYYWRGGNVCNWFNNPPHEREESWIAAFLSCLPCLGTPVANRKKFV